MKNSAAKRSIGEVLLLSISFLLLSVFYQRATPPLEASDEASHVDMVMYLHAHGRLPDLTRGEPIQFISQEFGQAPLYYALAAIWVRGADFSDAADCMVQQPRSPIGRADIPGYKNMWVPRATAVTSTQGTLRAVARIRILSMLLGLGTVLVVRTLARELAPDFRPAGLLAGAWVAFNPMFLFISNSVNNDNLLSLLSAAALLGLVRMDRMPLTLARAALVGAAIGLAILAKSSALFLGPLALAAVLSRRDETWGVRLRAAFLLVLVAVAISGWWFVRNKILYGEWMAVRLMTTLLPCARPHIDPWALIREWDGFLKSYWGVFGAFNVIFPDCAYDTFFALTAIALGMLVAALWKSRERAAWILSGAAGLNLLAVGYWTSLLTGSQGRYLFPTIGAHAALWVFSSRILGKRRAPILAGVALLLLGLACIGGAIVIPADYP